MHELKIGDIDVAVCAEHASAWFPAKGLQVARAEGQAEFDRILAAVDPSSTPEDEHPKGVCPDCGKPLETFEFAGQSGIFISNCSGCHGSYLTRTSILAMDNRFKTIDQHNFPGQTGLSRGQRYDAQQTMKGPSSSLGPGGVLAPGGGMYGRDFYGQGLYGQGVFGHGGAFGPGMPFAPGSRNGGSFWGALAGVAMSLVNPGRLF